MQVITYLTQVKCRVYSALAVTGLAPLFLVLILIFGVFADKERLGLEAVHSLKPRSSFESVLIGVKDCAGASNASHLLISLFDDQRCGIHVNAESSLVWDNNFYRPIVARIQPEAVVGCLREEMGRRGMLSKQVYGHLAATDMRGSTPAVREQQLNCPEGRGRLLFNPRIGVQLRVTKDNPRSELDGKSPPIDTVLGNSRSSLNYRGDGDQESKGKLEVLERRIPFAFGLCFGGYLLGALSAYNLDNERRHLRTALIASSLASIVCGFSLVVLSMY